MDICRKVKNASWDLAAELILSLGDVELAQFEAMRSNRRLVMRHLRDEAALGD